MDTKVLLLFGCASVAGLIMVAGGLWLLFKQKIYLDSRTGEPVASEVEVIGWGKVRIATPALAFFALGAVLLLFAPYKWAEVSGLNRDLEKAIRDLEKVTDRLPTTVTIRGKVKPLPPHSKVEIIAVSQSMVVHSEEEFSLPVVYAKGMSKDYTILYIAADGTIFDNPADLSTAQNGVLLVPSKEIPVGNVYDPPETSP